MEEQNTNYTSPNTPPVYPAGKPTANKPSPAEKPVMGKPPKTVPTFIGITIIVIVAIILFGGVFAYQYFATNTQQNGEFFASSQKTHQTAGPALSGVEGWKTYTNTEYGFEVKYPSDWKLESSNLPFLAILKSADFDYLNAEIDSKVLKGSSIMISEPRPIKDSLVEYISGMESVGFAISEKRNIKVDDVDAVGYYMGYEGPEKLFVSFIRNGYLYQVVFEAVGKERQDRDYPVLNQILSTFKFTTPASVAQSSITVTSPNGGEQWMAGATNRISWTSTGVKYVNLYIEDANNPSFFKAIPFMVFAASPTLASPGYYDWKFTYSDLPIPSTGSLPMNFRIRIDGLNDNSPDAKVVVSDKSDNYFIITK